MKSRSNVEDAHPKQTTRNHPDAEDAHLLRGKSPGYIRGWNSVKYRNGKPTRVAKQMTTWSYSSIKTFDQCPKKYYHTRVLQDVKDEGSEATVYDNLVHKAAELYVRDGAPIPPQYAYMQPILDTLIAIPGEKHCELELGLALSDKDYVPCEFTSPDRWWRGIADLLIVKGSSAFLVDYKTSKNAKYADTKQLDILAAAVFTHFPQIKKIKSALAFVVSNELVKKEHTADMRKSYIASFMPELDRLVTAEETGVWNAKSGPLCKFCPVVKCEHNKRR